MTMTAEYLGYYENGYAYPSVSAWPWWYSVGQTRPPVTVEDIPAPDPTKHSSWPGARALVRSTIQSVLGVDAIFYQIYMQIVQHLLRQGFIDSKTAGDVSRPAYIAKVRAWVRQSLYYADIDTIIDVGTRQLARYARAHGAGPFR
jgi:hypothetical protein